MGAIYEQSLLSNLGCDGKNLIFQEFDSKSCSWTKEENKAFEKALAMVDENTPDRWSRVADMIPGKTVWDVMNQYYELLEDVTSIEAGYIPVSGYLASPFTLDWVDSRTFDPFRKRASAAMPRGSDQERKKGVPWTEEEHRRFLQGLQKHGKGDWRNISRNFVISKTPTQVASHAQKYFLRQNSGGKDKRRPSIHDITTANLPTETTNNLAPVVISDDDDQKPLLLQQKPSNIMPKMLLDWTDPDNNGESTPPLMVFNASSHARQSLFGGTQYCQGAYACSRV